MSESFRGDKLERPKNVLAHEIAAREIDIHKFKGFLIWTQVPNLSDIFKNGFQKKAERSKPHWKYGGNLDQQPWEDTDGFFITAYDPAFHSFSDGTYPWPKAGQVGVLIAEELDPILAGSLYEQLQGNLETAQAVRQEAIHPSYIRGLVMNKNLIRLDNPHDTRKGTLPTPGGKIVQVTRLNPFAFGLEEYETMLKRRLDRLVGTACQPHLVPLYAPSGELIWPKFN